VDTALTFSSLGWIPVTRVPVRRVRKGFLGDRR
jgi:hypothetical protein